MLFRVSFGGMLSRDVFEQWKTFQITVRHDGQVDRFDVTESMTRAVYASFAPSPIDPMVRAKGAGVSSAAPPQSTPMAPPKFTGEISPPNTILAMDRPLPKIQIGNSDVFFINGSGQQFEVYLGPVLRRDQFMVESIDGLLKVSTRVTDAAGNLTAEIIRNEWKVLPPPGTWDRNYNNSALEVKDPKGRIVLQVSLATDAVQIQGAWHLGPEWIPAGMDYVIVRADPAGNGAQFVLYPKNPAPSVLWPEIKPLFAYPSERHLGELAKY
jgi:hypothetical protein